MLRAAVELDPAAAAVVSLDGCSVYDSIRRAAVLSKLQHVSAHYCGRTTRGACTMSARLTASNKAGGETPQGIRNLGAEVWRGDKPPAERRFVALGVPDRT